MSVNKDKRRMRLTKRSALVRGPLLAVLAALTSTDHVLPRTLARAGLGVGAAPTDIPLTALSAQRLHSATHRLLPPHLAHRLHIFIEIFLSHLRTIEELETRSIISE